jgi:Bacterial RNA polymerase, alpha chain C terminal domain
MAVIPPLWEDWQNRATEARQLKKYHCNDQFVCDALERIAQEFDQLVVYAGGADSFLHRRIDSIDFGKHANPRIRYMCENYYKWLPYENVSRPLVTVGDLLQRTEAELLTVPNFGLVSLEAIKRVIAEHGLWLGMSFDSVTGTRCG